MSKLWNPGFSLEQVVPMATLNPARDPQDRKARYAANRRTRDFSIFEIVQRPVSFIDAMKNQRQGSRYFKPMQTVRAGRPFGRPYPSRFN